MAALQRLKQEQLENIIDAFDARQDLHQGDVMLNEGDTVRKG